MKQSKTHKGGLLNHLKAGSWRFSLAQHPPVRWAALAAVCAAIGASTLSIASIASLASQTERAAALSAAVEAMRPDTVRLADLTHTEIAALMRAGYDRVIVPTGGTEQNGYHMVLGKHNYVVRYTAEKIAREVGRTLVAPVMAYVPEGRISPPEGHMKFKGTLSLPEPVFEQVLEHTARSLIAHGFKHIFFIGDSGGNQKAQQRVAETLSRAFKNRGIQIANISDYYAANGQQARLKAKGFRMAEIGSHAGIRDTSELLAVHPQGIRHRLLQQRDRFPSGFARTGMTGHPERATAEIGKEMLALKIEAGVRQIRRLLQEVEGKTSARAGIGAVKNIR